MPKGCPTAAQEAAKDAKNVDFWWNLHSRGLPKAPQIVQKRWQGAQKPNFYWSFPASVFGYYFEQICSLIFDAWKPRILCSRRGETLIFAKSLGWNKVPKIIKK